MPLKFIKKKILYTIKYFIQHNKKNNLTGKNNKNNTPSENKQNIKCIDCLKKQCNYINMSSQFVTSY